MRITLAIAALSVAAVALAPPGARADTAAPLTLTITQDGAKVSDALGVLQKESNATLVVDNTVIGTMGRAKVSFPTLNDMLDFLRTMEPGLTWAKLYLPSNRPVPTSDQCYDLVRTLTWLAQQGSATLVSSTTTITVVQKNTTTLTPPTGQREIWYVSDEQIRYQRYLDAQAAAQKAQTAAQTTQPVRPQPGMGRQRP